MNLMLLFLTLDWGRWVRSPVFQIWEIRQYWFRPTVENSRKSLGIMFKLPQSFKWTHCRIDQCNSGSYIKDGTRSSRLEGHLQPNLGLLSTGLCLPAGSLSIFLVIIREFWIYSRNRRMPSFRYPTLYPYPNLSLIG